MIENVVEITMRVGLWNGIDAAMDNKANNARWEYWNGVGEMGDPADPDVGPVSRCAAAIRAEGRRQIDNAWLRPADEQITVSLTRQRWEFILADAHDSLPVYEELARSASGGSRSDMHDSADLCRETILVVGRALADGVSVDPL